MDLKEEAALGPAVADHWYYVAKGRALRRILGDNPVDEILDVGAGSGVFTKFLLDAGFAQGGVCVDPGYASDREEIHNGCKISFVRGVENVSQDLILMMDVLEHVDDDLALLKEYTDRMPEGGRVLITVPAFQFLWSGHDVFLDHRRRYTLGGVEDLVQRAGLRVLRCRYFYGILFPVAATLRLIDRARLRTGNIAPQSQMRPAPPWLNGLLVGVHDIERWSLFPINRLAGLSVFCLAGR